MYWNYIQCGVIHNLAKSTILKITSFRTIKWRIYIFVDNVNIVPDIGLSLIQHQPIIWIKIIFVSWPQVTDFCLILVEISQIMHLELLSVKNQPSFLKPIS